MDTVYMCKTQIELQDCCGPAVEAECANPVPGSVILLEAWGSLVVWWKLENFADGFY